MSRLLLLDGHSLAYRAFYALPAENFSTKTGQNTNAVFGFTSMLINLLRDEVPTHLAVAFDLSRPAGDRITLLEVHGADGTWAPLDPARRYLVATNNFMRNGGDGYTVMRDRAVDPYDAGPGVAEIVAAALGR